MDWKAVLFAVVSAAVLIAAITWMYRLAFGPRDAFAYWEGGWRSRAHYWLKQTFTDNRVSLIVGMSALADANSKFDTASYGWAGLHLLLGVWLLLAGWNGLASKKSVGHERRLTRVLASTFLVLVAILIAGCTQPVPPASADASAAPAEGPAVLVDDLVEPGPRGAQ